MKDSIILHHYEASPYAEKIRLMFGLTDSHWLSLLSPVWPPRPNVDPLTGGYRRIPVAQIGADVFCDTALIAQEVARLNDCPALDPATVRGSALALMKQAEGEAFFAAISAVSPFRLVNTLMRDYGPIGAGRFIKDRVSLMSGGTLKPPGAAAAKLVLRALLDALDARLGECPWVGGDNPSVADFAVYHPLWLHMACNRRPLEAGEKVQCWLKKVEDIGHGKREEISQADAFEAARLSEPRSLPPSRDDVAVKPGIGVRVAPLDYGVQPVTGTLAAVTDDRIIVARESRELGMLHVHFPRCGYSLVAA